MANPFSTFSDGTTDYEVKDAAARTSLSSHEAYSVNSSIGAHGIRYYNDKLSYKSGNTWNEIQTGGGAQLLTQAEYNALSSSEKQADIIYIISDA